jgi:hypothetical protein
MNIAVGKDRQARSKNVVVPEKKAPSDLASYANTSRQVTLELT